MRLPRNRPSNRALPSNRRTPFSNTRCIFELGLNIEVCHALPYVAHKVFFVANELVARIEFSRRCYGKIFRAASASGYALVNARTAFEVEHVVIERKRFALFASFDHHVGKFLVFLENHLFVVLGECVLVGGRTHDGFHAELVETEVEHCLNVFCKVGISMRESAAHIVVFPPLAFTNF